MSKQAGIQKDETTRRGRAMPLQCVRAGWATAALCALLALPLTSRADAESPDAAIDRLAMPFLDLSTTARSGIDEHRPVDDDTAEPAYHIGVSYTPERRGFGLHADAWQVETDLASLSALTPGLMPDPTLSGDEGLRLTDADHEALLNVGGGPDRRSRGVDLTASYVWDSPRFGQFVISTRATYVYNQNSIDGVKEPGSLPVTGHPALSQVPELQSSLMLSWQSGNHHATATTHVAADTFDVTDMNAQQLNELVGHIATLDLRYGYNLQSSRSNNNARISVGLRNTVDRRPLQQLRVPGDSRDGVLDANGSVAYGTIKYQF